MIKSTLLVALALPAMVLATPVLADSKPPAAPIAIPPPPHGKGEIVFFRTGFMGALISCAVSENGQKVSSLPPGSYFIAVVEPGKHTYSVSSEATDTLNVEVEPDEVQYASCHIKMGIMAGRPVLNPATAEAFTGKTYKMVSASKMGEGALRPDGSTSAAALASAAPTPTPPAAAVPATAPSPAPASAVAPAPAPVGTK
jgi:hypothetical protein